MKKVVSSWRHSLVYGGQKLSILRTSFAWEGSLAKDIMVKQSKWCTHEGLRVGTGYCKWLRWKGHPCDGEWTVTGWRQNRVKGLLHGAGYQSSSSVRKMSPEIKTLGWHIGIVVYLQFGSNHVKFEWVWTSLFLTLIICGLFL